MVSSVVRVVDLILVGFRDVSPPGSVACRGSCCVETVVSDSVDHVDGTTMACKGKGCKICMALAFVGSDSVSVDRSCAWGVVFGVPPVFANKGGVA